MCKCEKKVENGNEVEVGVLMGIIDALDEIFGSNATNAAKACGNSINLDEEIDHVVFNDPATIVFWKDGTKTVTKCHAGDAFNKETGLAMCIIRKLTKNKHYNNVFEKYCH